MGKDALRIDTDILEELYAYYNDVKYVHPDPLEIVLTYDDPLDREIAALIASSLAYGRVLQIMKSVNLVLDKMGPPRRFLERVSKNAIARKFAGFKHRFTTDEELVDLLYGIKLTNERFGSLESCFRSVYDEEDDDVIPSLGKFVDIVVAENGSCYSSLLPCPPKGSACKRLNLFLKWMVRKDKVDPGGWSAVDSSKLVVPLDTHMYRIGSAFGMTERKQANLKTAREITGGFRKVAPEDPTKYDFALTRIGMKHGARVAEYLKQYSSRRISGRV